MAKHRSVGEGEKHRFDPTAGPNSELTLTWNASDELTQIDKKIGDITYRKTLTWVGGNPTVISDWVKV